MHVWRDPENVVLIVIYEDIIETGGHIHTITTITCVAIFSRVTMQVHIGDVIVISQVILW